MPRGLDTGKDPRRKVGRGNMRKFGWIVPPTDGTPKFMDMESDVSDNPANRKVNIGSTPNAEGHSPVVEFPEGNANGVKLITGDTNHKTKMGARRAAKGMVKNNSQDLLNRAE
jgi:hypothetical protein